MQEFTIKTSVTFGRDSLSKLNRFKNKKIWIICDAFLAEGQSLRTLLKHIDSSNQTEVFHDVVPDPPISVIVNGIMKAEKLQPDILIAFGGGSAIDSAKGILYFAKKIGSMEIEQFIAIPTTSGTGSEVTAATVITDPLNKVKYPLFVKEIVPDTALLDAELVTTVPANVTANTGMDVLTHAIEAYVSTEATDFTDALAEKAARLTVQSLIDCYADGQNIDKREKMHNASTMAGMAFSICNLGMNHSLAHQLGAQFHVPHGLANAMLLGTVIRFNASKCKKAQKKYAELTRIIGLCEQTATDSSAIESLIGKITSMMKAMEMPARLLDYGVSRQQVLDVLDDIAENALHDACLHTNPIQPSYNELKGIVQSII